MTRAARAAPRSRGASPIWRKAPLVLLRYPGLLVSLGVGGFLLSVAVAAYPLFVSATASTLLGAEIDSPLVTRYGAGISYKSTDVSFTELAPPGGRTGPLYRVRGGVFRELVSESPVLAPPVRGTLSPILNVSSVEHPKRGRTARLFGSPGAAQHVDLVGEEAGTGVLLPDLVADALRVEAGDEIAVRYGSRTPVEIEVEGVYRGLYSQPRSGYWLQWAEDIYTACADCSPPPQFMVVDPERFLPLARELDVRDATFGWQAPVASGIRLVPEEARELAGLAGRIRVAMSDPNGYEGALFDCCHDRASLQGIYDRTTFSSAVGGVLSQVEERVAAVEGPGRLLQGAGIIVALGVLAAAGVFSLAARRTEAGLLFARGTSPIMVGAKGSLEAVIPGLVGGAAGLGSAVLFVSVVGPEGALASVAVAQAAGGSAVAVVASIAAIGVVSAISFLGRHHQTRFGVLARVPWELALLALALYSFRRLQADGALVSQASLGVRQPSVFLLLFPVSLLGGFTLLGARLLRVGFRRVGERVTGLGPATYLTVHRVAAAPGLTVLLVAAAGLSLGVFVQGQTLVRSLETTVLAKARLFVGSDAQAWVSRSTEVPDDFPYPVTRVGRLAHAGTANPGGEVDLLGVDPDTLGRAAFWRESFADSSLEEITEALTTEETGAVPVLVAGDESLAPTSFDIHERTIPVEVVARATAFPGMLAGRPLLVVDFQTLERAYGGTGSPFTASNARTELWVKGDPERAAAALADTDPGPFAILTVDQVTDLPYITAVVDTFVVLNALGLGTGILAITAMLMYLEARQRSQVVAYGLSLRMGMTPAGHRRSLALELTSLLAPSYVVAVGLALLATVLMLPFLDPLSRIPPSPLVTAPVVSISIALGLLLVVSMAGAWASERRARATPLGEVMRVAE